MDVFRGQADAAWPLSTSLYRALSRREALEGATTTEFWMLRDFRRGAARYLNDCPSHDDYVGWLSLMQHHGAPTRLLDFTHSFYVACYFALIDTTGDSAVWAVDDEFLFRASSTAFAIKHDGLRDQWEDESTAYANKYLGGLLGSAAASEPDEFPLGVLAVTPFTLHARLPAQQGLFLMPLDLELDFSANLKAFVKRGKSPVKKIVLTEALRIDALAHLREMNITAETLFPGIDGFARSLLQRRRVF